MAVVLSLGCAVLAALSYGVGSVLQAAAARHAERRANLDPLLLVRLVGQVPYVASLALDLLGFVASVVALRTLPLFLVQSALAASVGVTAIAASVAFGFRLLRYERVALIALMLGFALLAVSARPEHATALGAVGQCILACGVVVVIIAGALSARLDDRQAGIGLALCAGLSWAGTGIAARARDSFSVLALARQSRCALSRRVRAARHAPVRHGAPTRVCDRGGRDRGFGRDRCALAHRHRVPRRPRSPRVHVCCRTRIRRDGGRIDRPRAPIRTTPARVRVRGQGGRRLTADLGVRVREM